MLSHHTILSLETKGSTFFGDARFDFADGLNAFMAGRGSGKTTLLLLLRFGVGHPIPAHHARELETHLSDALGTGTVIVRARTRHGVEYIVTRVIGEAPKVWSTAGERLDISLDGELFGIDAYAAKEIEQIADRPLEQLRLLDRFAPGELQALARALDDVDRRLAQVGGEVDRAAAQIEADEGREAELPAVIEALKGMAPGEASSGGELAAAEARRPARGREQAAMAAIGTEIAQVRRALDLFAAEGPRRLGSAVDAALEAGPDPAGAIFARSHQAVQAAVAAIEGVAGAVRAELARVEGALGIEGRALAAFHDREDETYRALVVRQDTDRGRAAERERLHRRRDELDTLARRLAESRRARAEREAAYAALVEERDDVLRRRFAVRVRIAAEITLAVGGAVRVSVTRGGIVQPYLALLTEILHGTGLQKDLLEQIADGVPPAELYDLVVRDDPAPITLVDRAKTGKTARAHKVLHALRASGRARELHTVRLEDLPLIELKVDTRLEPSARLSTGQKVTAIVPILLLPSATPLVVDQIEDHLDNRFIFQVLVKTLLAAKGSRQFLFATHNPCIVVLAEAERVFELAAQDKRGKLAACGDVDEMRERIELVLEGGREAFVKRGERYGHRLADRAGPDDSNGAPAEVAADAEEEE